MGFFLGKGILMTRKRRWLLALGLVLTLLFFYAGDSLNRPPLFASLENHPEKANFLSSPNYGDRLARLTRKPQQAPLNLAYATCEKAREMIPVSLESGLSGPAIPLEFSAKVIVFSPNGQSVYLADQEHQKLTRMELATRVLYPVASPSMLPSQLALSPKGQRGYAIYPETREVFVLDFLQNQFESLAVFSELPESVVVDPLETHLYMSFRDSANWFHWISAPAPPARCYVWIIVPRRWRFPAMEK